MKCASIILLALASFAVAAPVSRSARGDTDVESIIARASQDSLKVTFTDPSGSVAAPRRKASIKHLEQVMSKEEQKAYPFCSVDFGDGGRATYRCFSSSSKKIGQQGPAGAINVNK